MNHLIDKYLNEKKKSKKTFTLDQINRALLKAGVGPSIITQAMYFLNAVRSLAEGGDE